MSMSTIATVVTPAVAAAAGTPAVTGVAPAADGRVVAVGLVGGGGCGVIVVCV